MQACGYKLIQVEDGIARFESAFEPAGFIALDVHRVGIAESDLRDALDAYGVSSDLVASALAEMGF